MEVLPSIGNQLQFSRLLTNVKNLTRALELSGRMRKGTSVEESVLPHSISVEVCQLVLIWARSCCRSVRSLVKVRGQRVLINSWN